MSPVIKEEEEDDDDIIAWLYGKITDASQTLANFVKRPKPAIPKRALRKQVPKENQKGQSTKVFHCYYCPAKFKMKAYFPMHVLKHLEEGNTEPYLVPDSAGRKVHPAYIDGTVWPCLQNERNQAYKHATFRGKSWKVFHCYYCPVTFRYKHYLSSHVLGHLVKGHQKFEVTDSNGKKVHPAYLPEGDSHPSQSILFKRLDDKPYKCHLCNFTTKHPSVLRSHLKRKAQSALRPRNVSCFHCGYAAVDKVRMRMHMHRHLPGEYACELCIYRGRTPNHLKVHMRKHTNEKPFECHVCDERFAQVYLLQKHLITHKPQRHDCPHCQFFATRVSALTEHVNSVHFGPKNYRCPHCKYESGNIVFLRSHVKSIHRMRLTKIKCRFCDVEVRRTTTLKSHEKSHTNPEGYPCDKCAFVTKVKNSFASHQLVHTGEKPHACDLCDYRSTSQSGVARHMVVHVTDRPFKCSFCDVTFKTLQGAKGHENFVHKQAIETFRCDVCNYETLHKFHMKSHKATHTDRAKSFACGLCDYAGTTKALLKIHMGRIHTSEGEHKCKFCNFSSNKVSGLAPHMRVCHPDFDFYSCSYCSETFKFKLELVEHERVHLGQPIKRKGKRGPNKYMKCRFCYFESSVMRKFRLHELTHNNGIQCGQCSETFTSLESLEEHEKEHAIKVKPKKSVRKKCRFCDFTSIHVRRLRLHEWWHIDNDTY